MAATLTYHTPMSPRELEDEFRRTSAELNARLEPVRRTLVALDFCVKSVALAGLQALAAALTPQAPPHRCSSRYCPGPEHCPLQTDKDTRNGC